MDGVKISMNPHYVFSPSNKQCRVDKSNRGGVRGALLPTLCANSYPTTTFTHVCTYSKACKCVGNWLVSRAACGGISSHTHTLTQTYKHTLTHTNTCTHTLTHMHTLTYMHTLTHTYTHTNTHTHSHKHMHTHSHTCSHKHTLTHMHTHSHICTHTHTYAHTLTLTHTHIHTHTHTQMHMYSLKEEQNLSCTPSFLYFYTCALCIMTTQMS